MSSSVIYVLPRKNYFAEGMRGRVAHAAGVVSGLVDNQVAVTVISGPGAEAFIEGADIISVTGDGHSSWLKALQARLTEHLNTREDPVTVLIRYGVRSGFRIAAAIRTHSDVRWCFEVNSLMFHQKPHWPQPLRQVILRTECSVLNRAHAAYVVSDALEADIRSGGYKKQVYAVPNGGPAPITIPSQRSDARLRFVFFGVFQIYYDLDILLDAFSQLRQNGLDAELILHGDGPQFERISDRVKDDPDIACPGRYRLDALAREHLDQAATILLLPMKPNTQSRIVSPIKLFEYMATGLPIIASNLGALPDFLEHQADAFLVQEHSVEHWAEAMLTLANEPDTRDALRRGVVDTYRHHTWTDRMRTLSDHFNQLHARS